MGGVVQVVPNHCGVVSNMVDGVYGLRAGQCEVVWPLGRCRPRHKQPVQGELGARRHTVDLPLVLTPSGDALRRDRSGGIVRAVVVHLIDGTFELFRYFLGPGAAFDRKAPEELRAVRGVIGSVLGLLEGGATHVGVATDHVIESFRNALWPGYKTDAGLDPVLVGQFEPLEAALRALGVTVWAMVAFEADDALATAAMVAAVDARVDQVVVCSPDKDLAQCVRGARIVQLDRRTGERRDEPAVRERFGVSPSSIPDWLALVGDSADGYPGLPGWGPRSAATVLACYRHLEHIPTLATQWDVSVRRAVRLATTLAEHRQRALLFRELATLRADAPISADVDALRWTGPHPDFGAWAERLGAPALHERASRLGAAGGHSP